MRFQSFFMLITTLSEFLVTNHTPDYAFFYFIESRAWIKVSSVLVRRMRP